MPPESFGDKFCRLDINMDVDGQRVDLEIQVDNDGGYYPERTLYYWAREYSTALPTAGKYAELPRTVVISIVGFKLFSCPEYHSEMTPAYRSLISSKKNASAAGNVSKPAPYRRKPWVGKAKTRVSRRYITIVSASAASAARSYAPTAPS